MCDTRGECSSNAAEVERAVLGYLNKHPQAADTLDGITSWWLPQQRYETARERIEDALTRLVNSGVLRRQSLPGGELLYQLAARP
jgi:hypothetical protein